ncbi:hypothetical protein [Brucella pseudogrignonensis]|uniref:hypothetical protein n=1 Tax=Brucella pseudogrignonensis TaxID=419475 RepID=UPI0011B0CAB9|nr:hypothetical protein [Brucella pseudogrignonensis]MQP40953.1 hypothetical protein [Ochrobactrum sp. MYb237]
MKVHNGLAGNNQFRNFHFDCRGKVSLGLCPVIACGNSEFSIRCMGYSSPKKVQPVKLGVRELSSMVCAERLSKPTYGKSAVLPYVTLIAECRLCASFQTLPHNSHALQSGHSAFYAASDHIGVDRRQATFVETFEDADPPYGFNSLLHPSERAILRWLSVTLLAI